jgi:ribosomal protein S18 acetylase RimI-like enzyme
MSETKITFTSGGVELLDDIQPLWEGLNQHHALVSPHFKADFHAKTFARRKAALLGKYAEGKLRIDLAQANGETIGYLISAITTDGVGEIESIFIDNAYRGQTIGDQLMRRALAWLDEQSVHTKVIDVAFGNERAYAFYARYDFYPRVVTLKQKDAK